ncbi:MAG: hypothetical protein LBE83_01770 [Propionibacteriaceae bacterium]|nr:hypothetical protein [Propionibacteriaceae bacterium]
MTNFERLHALTLLRPNDGNEDHLVDRTLEQLGVIHEALVGLAGLLENTTPGEEIFSGLSAQEAARSARGLASEVAAIRSRISSARMVHDEARQAMALAVEWYWDPPMVVNESVREVMAGQVLKTMNDACDEARKRLQAHINPALEESDGPSPRPVGAYGGGYAGGYGGVGPYPGGGFESGIVGSQPRSISVDGLAGGATSVGLPDSGGVGWSGGSRFTGSGSVGSGVGGVGAGVLAGGLAAQLGVTVGGVFPGGGSGSSAVSGSGVSGVGAGVAIMPGVGGGSSGREKGIVRRKYKVPRVLYADPELQEMLMGSSGPGCLADLKPLPLPDGDWHPDHELEDRR